MAVKITEDSAKAAKLKKEIEDEPESASTRVVGFAIPSKEKDEEEYEDDE